MSKKVAKNSYADLKKEIVIFLIAFGLLLLLSGILALINLRENPIPLWGLSRNIAIGVPVTLIAIIHLVAGFCLAVTSNKVFATVGLVAGILLAALYFVFMISVTGGPPINAFSAVVVAIPIVLSTRVSMFLKADDLQRADEARAGIGDRPNTPPPPPLN